MSDYVIDVHHLNKSFNGKPAVINFSLKVKAGEIFGFLGPNGSGKTTTIRMLCGLMTPDSGGGQCLGFDILTQSVEIKRQVGYVPQLFSLYQDLTVRENLEFIARTYGERDYQSRARTIMEDTELSAFKNRLAGRLSGGWKQRLSLAAALIHDPKLLLLDEPTAGVDPKARRDFWNYISHLTAKGVTSLVTTHYMDEAERCNRLAYMVYGNLLTVGEVNKIIDDEKLIVWAATGDHLPKLFQALQGQAGVEQVVIWGNVLRVCGVNKELLDQVIAKFSEYHWERMRASLEEVFIHLVGDKRYE